MTYRQLQAILKEYKLSGMTSIKLNATKKELEAEYERLTSEPQAMELTTETPKLDAITAADLDNADKAWEEKRATPAKVAPKRASQKQDFHPALVVLACLVALPLVAVLWAIDSLVDKGNDARKLALKKVEACKVAVANWQARVIRPLSFG